MTSYRSFRSILAIAIIIAVNKVILAGPTFRENYHLRKYTADVPGRLDILVPDIRKVDLSSTSSSIESMVESPKAMESTQSRRKNSNWKNFLGKFYKSTSFSGFTKRQKLHDRANYWSISNKRKQPGQLSYKHKTKHSYPERRDRRRDLHQNTGSRTPTAFSSEIQSYSRPLGTTRQGGVRIKSKYFNRRQIMEALAGHNSFNRNYG